MNVQCKNLLHVGHNEVLSFISLLDQTWPENIPNGISKQQRIQRFYNEKKDVCCHFIIDKDHCIGYAESFERTIQVENQFVSILALASVCVAKSHQKIGLGKMLVADAYNRLSTGHFRFSLFQTSVPDFYRQIGAQVIHNQIINSKHHDDPSKNPFWDKYIMIYPASAADIKGTIDLKGKGY